MTPGFLNLPVRALTRDGRNWTLLEPLEYCARSGRIYRAAAGTTTDGPSVPEVFRMLISPFGPAWVCGVLHDAGYRDTLEMLSRAGGWRHIRLPRAACDDLFREALAVQRVPATQVECFYQAVSQCGGKAFREDRAVSLLED